MLFIDTGFFNIQVLQRALKVFEIELIPYASQDAIAKQARDSPESIQAYICNLGLHWFTIRQFGSQYFDLNSFYYVPELISNMILLTYLNLIQEKGYSVFIVHGTLPECVADQQLTANPINQIEYRLLTEGLPKFIRDKNFKGNIKNLDKYGNPIVTLPRYLYEEFRKNPNNSDIRQKINTFLPEGVSIEDVPELTGCSHHHCDHSHFHFILVGTSRSDIDGQLFGRCNCLRHRRHPQVPTEPLAPCMMNDSFADDPNKLQQQQSRTITRHMTQYIIEEPNLDNRNKLHQHRVITSEMLVMNRSTDGENRPLDNHGVQSMAQANIGLQNAEDDLLQHVMARSLLNTSEMNDDKYHLEKLNQRLLDEAIAASLTTDDSVLKQFEDAPESIPITTMNLEPISTKNPSSPPVKDAYSLPPIDTHPLTPENKSSPASKGYLFTIFN